MLAILALHGAGKTETDLHDFTQQVAPNLPCLAPRGRFAEGQGYTFFRRRPDRSIDAKDLMALATQDLAGKRGWAREAGGMLLLVGYSSGAIYATALLASDPSRFAGAVLLRPEPIAPSFAFPDLTQKPVLLLSGLRDERRKADDAQRLAGQMMDAGALVTHHVLDTGHGWAPEQADIVLARAWLAAALP